MENITEEIVIDRKEINSSENPKAPFGYIFPVGKDFRITVWKQVDYDKIPTGIQGTLSYSIVVNGAYTNYTYQDFQYSGLTINKEDITFTDDMIAEFPEALQGKLKQGDGTIPYELFGVPIIQEDVEVIKMPRETLLKLLGALK